MDNVDHSPRSQILQTNFATVSARGFDNNHWEQIVDSLSSSVSETSVEPLHNSLVEHFGLELDKSGRRFVFEDTKSSILTHVLRPLLNEFVKNFSDNGLSVNGSLVAMNNDTHEFTKFVITNNVMREFKGN